VITHSKLATTDAMQADVDFFHEAFADWLADPDITVACGLWSDGAILELVPEGQASLLPAAYDGCFTGVRELRLPKASHHMHIDFGRIHKLSYAITPSVCLEFRPSFEIRFLIVGPGGAPTNKWMVSMLLSRPYTENKLDTSQIQKFLNRAKKHKSLRPDLVELSVDAHVQNSSIGTEILTLLPQASVGVDKTPDWTAVLATWITPEPAAPWTIEPPCLLLLHEALALKDASLVIYREKALIEFKTEKLGGLHLYEEDGHTSWQIGALDDHHCHLALGAVTKVLFSAEPVSCQGGGLNYTVWFLTSGPSGNPYRRDGYFSVVLNKPYEGEQPRLELIEPVIDLYRRFSTEAYVLADSGFLQVMSDGPPGRSSASSANHA